MITIHECVLLLIFVPSVMGQVTIPPPHSHEEHSGLRLPARPECLSTPLQGWKEWVPTSEPRRVEVEWSISNGICSDYNSCFGQDAAADENFTMDPQMEPLTLQEGDALSFHLGAVDAESLAPVMQPYWVSEQGFRDCDLTAGRPIIATPTNTVFMVPSEYLRPGKNYFIGSTTDSILRCEYGLRLNVTVKSHDCTAPGLATSWCWDKGRCLTNLHQSKYSCQCCYGWTAKYCDNENACDVTPLPCKNGATCHDELNPHGQQYHCECYPGYYGATCEYRLDNLCLVERCQNDATCSGNQTHYRCNCLEGFTGPHCEQNINDCDPDPCPEGVCVDKVNDYLCYCPAGRQGRNCEVLLNQCASSPCQNGGFCEVVGDGWQCHCTLGYTGPDCTTTVNLCASNPCGENAEECVPTVNTIECGCKAGFRGARCEQNINECLSVPCQHDGACEDGIGTYTCHCQEGYSGRHCQVSDAIEELEWDNVIVSPEHHVNPIDFNTDEETSEYDRLHNMYIIAGTLGGAVFIAFLVIVVCYCRFHGFDKACPIAQFKHKLLREDTDTNKGIEETSNNDRTVRISSITTEGRPSSDAIVQATSSGGAYGDNTQNAPLMNPLKSQQI